VIFIFLSPEPSSSVVHSLSTTTPPVKRARNQTQHTHTPR
jgi:hypothetical protein